MSDDVGTSTPVAPAKDAPRELWLGRSAIQNPGSGRGGQSP